MPCFNPPQKWKKGPTLNTKISPFFYISNCLCWLLFRNTRMLLSKGEALFLTSWLVFFLFFLFFFWLRLARPNCPMRSASNVTCPVRCSVLNQQPVHVALFFLFHITKLQLYSHMFKFKFLFLNALKKQQKSSVLLVTLRLQNSFF